MRCLTPSEIDVLFGAAGFSTVANSQSHRIGLQQKNAEWQRVVGRPTMDATRLPEFAGALNSWLPTKRRRLLLLSHWFDLTTFINGFEAFAAARRGLGELRSIAEAPRHCFDALDYDLLDQTEMQPDYRSEASLLVGFMSAVMVNEWDGWLIADKCTDAIEFWEGNICVYSVDKTRLKVADALLDSYGCSREMA